ncbi:2-keto-4-pentenoate hydratase/2-oxohepta-3-ene-1,7-dioic acid hydratase in catechol pathway [Paenibacillus phyllosphaerae]|uniref:2-keto-4-pentenoate hydratase/2-oxohepta-3-ene-1,7-dioic acid hydratase in catechol pathway n=1 Tax=Paenibacillus phyllosphaerae TaxID=274593 RepID=A0A7W5B5J1_9BACL|nr:fumarylacetoacetate hydrolase family protein [Paenibacillus phyllosphaerae]MBB3114758.1 2-keto-4-pentenoate hydratase/2-oxohepta-3-ene-1,7-dioic acid hydratase in catechol pathway [Paenibacillus phyllosphaerae]
MKLVTIAKPGKYTLGVKTERGIIDIEEALREQAADFPVPQEVMAVIEGGQAAVEALDSYVASLKSEDASYVHNEANIALGPCVSQPNKIICVGLNYRKHAEETNAPIPEYPILFNKFNNALAGHGQDIVIPKVTRRLDYEAELVIVIGKTTKNVAKEHALEHVFGYACANDLSARDLQKRTVQWLLGKSCDGFCPLGPYLVTADETGDPNTLAIRTIVNGEVRQHSNTSDMIFACDEIVSYVSAHMTLVPGDIILTGTPEGVVIDMPKERRVYLQPGDEVTIEIEKLGSLTNRFIEEN